MIENLIDYAVSDVFARLVLAAGGERAVELSKKGYSAKVRRDRFDLDLLADMDTDDVPSVVVAEKLKGSFGTAKTGPSLSADKIALYWRDDQDEGSHRMAGPAEVILLGVKKWHVLDMLHRDPAKGTDAPRPAIDIERITFNWIQHDKFARSSGPFQIEIVGFSGYFEKGKLTEWHSAGALFDFPKMNGKRVPQERIERFLEAHPEIKIDMFTTGEFFPDPLDEYIFLEDLEKV